MRVCEGRCKAPPDAAGQPRGKASRCGDRLPPQIPGRLWQKLCKADLGL